LVLSDSDESGVTYTEVSSPFEGLSDIGSPRVDDHEYLELPGMLEDPYVEAAFQAPPSPDYMPGPEEDPINRGDDGDDEEGSSKDVEDNDMDIEADDDEEEEEDLAPADSVVVVLPATDQAPSAEETEPFETDESAATPSPHSTYPLPPSLIRSLGYRAAMIWMRAEATSTSHSLPLPPPFILSPTRSDAPSSGIPPPLPISVPTSLPPLLLPSASRREGKLEVTLPPQKRLGIALGPRYEVGESSSAAARPAGGLRADYGFVATMDREIRRDPEREVGYGITDSWDEIVETQQGAPVSTDTELGRHMTAFETRVRQDTNEIYTRLDDEQSQRQLLAEARLSREAWRRSMDASDLTRGEVMSLRTTMLGQMSEIRELHAADRRRHAVTSEMLKADHRRSAEMRELRTTDHTRQQQLIQILTVMQSLYGHVTTLHGQGQQGSAGGPAQPELPEEAGSSS
ncbi:hypothetical protein Tco_1461940, partial [Tanacetum coccineum]